MTVAPPVLAEPPVPADADLSDFRFMPLEIARLRRSKAWLICKRRPELAFYIINLFAAAWHERPAGSLEDDDDVLADAAMCPPERWAEVRADVLRGWFKAADGRLYHPVVAEKVMDSWQGKMAARWRKECDRVRKENLRRRDKGLAPLDLPPEPERTSGRNPPETALKGEERNRDRDRENEGKGSPNSEAGASAAGAPPAGSGLARMVFGQGVDWLRGVTGKPDPQCRSLIGKWRKSVGDAVLIELLAEAQRQDIQAPEAWITAAIKARERSGPRGSPGGAMPANAEQAMAQYEADPAWRGVAA